MKSAKPGKNTSAAEVTNVSPHGLWLLVDQTEHFLPFEQFPWFREATIGELSDVRRPHSRHLHWPQLDVDLAVESLANPEGFPLVSKKSGKAKPPAKKVTARRRS